MYSKYRRETLFYPFHSFKKSNLKKGTMKEMLKDVDKYELSSCEYENYVNIASSMILKHYSRNNISILHASIDYDKVFRQHENFTDCNSNNNFDVNRSLNKKENLKKIFNDMTCGWYSGNQKYNEDIFFNKINKEMVRGKIVYVYLDLDNYDIETDKKSKLNESQFHSTSIILYPSKKRTGNNMIKTYNVYHFNPHGCDSVYTDEYEIYISRKRSKTIHLDVGLDRYVIDKMTKAFNDYTEEYEDKYVSLYYDITKYCNYTGANLQIGDNYGICYIYPFILFNEIASKFDESIEFHHFRRQFSRIMPSYKNLIETEDINKIVYIVLSKYFTNVKFRYLEFIEQTDYTLIKVPSTQVTEKEDKFDIDIEKVLKKSKGHYTYLHYMYMNYLLQPLFKNKALSIIDYDDESNDDSDD